MKRREFITLLGGAAGWPLAARAQQPMPVVGLLNAGSPESIAANKAAFLQGLKENSFVEGQNLVIDDRFADFRNERVPALAADLVRRRVNVIAAMGGGQASVFAAKAATVASLLLRQSARCLAIRERFSQDQSGPLHHHSARLRNGMQ